MINDILDSIDFSPISKWKKNIITFNSLTHFIIDNSSISINYFSKGNCFTVIDYINNRFNTKPNLDYSYNRLAFLKSNDSVFKNNKFVSKGSISPTDYFE